MEISKRDEVTEIIIPVVFGALDTELKLLHKSLKDIGIEIHIVLQRSVILYSARILRNILSQNLKILAN